MSLTSEIVTDAARFSTIQTAWQELWQRSGGYIFQSHDWITGWLVGIEDRKEVRLQIALIWDGARLCGAIPCAVQRRSGLRILTWAGHPFSDYCDCLVDPAHETVSLLSAMWDQLNAYGGFDLISLQQIRPDAKCRELLDQLIRDGNRLRTGDREERCMRIDNQWTNGEAFFRSLNKKGRNNHTRGKRILAELGGEVTFRVVEEHQEGFLQIDEVLRLKDEWLRVNDAGSPLLGPDREVLRTILRKTWESGLAKIFLLEAGGTIAAASVNFVYASRMEAYFTAYDAAFDRASPGTILIVEYARWSFDRGLRHVDFLRGDEPFKFRMANAETILGNVTGFRTFMGHVAVSGHRWLSRRRQKPENVVALVDDLETVA